MFSQQTAFLSLSFTLCADVICGQRAEATMTSAHIDRTQLSLHSTNYNLTPQKARYRPSLTFCWKTPKDRYGRLLSTSKQKFSCSKLTTCQKRTLHSMLRKNKNVFVNIPSSTGNSLICQTLLKLFDVCLVETHKRRMIVEFNFECI